MKACEAQLFEMREMEEMVEFMKNELPNWEPSLLQVQHFKFQASWCRPSQLFQLAIANMHESA